MSLLVVITDTFLRTPLQPPGLRIAGMLLKHYLTTILCYDLRICRKIEYDEILALK